MLFKKRNEDEIALPKATASVPPPPPVKPETAEAPAAPALRTSLGPDASVTGKLSFSVPTRLDGKLKGEVRASDLLLIGKQGFVDGGVHALELIVEGEVHGEVFVNRRVEVAASGRIYGRVEAGCLHIEPGGLVNGECKITPAPRA